MQDILTVYDDRGLPEAEVRQITGEKSYGSIIYRRKRLLDRVRELSPGAFLVLDTDSVPALTGNMRRMKILHIFSGAVIEDKYEYEMLRRKVLYTNGCYHIKAGNSVAAVVFNNAEEWEKSLASDPGREELGQKAREFKEIDCRAFYDITDKDNFLTYITGGFEARFFNSVDGDEFEVVKRSTDVRKIKAEYGYYRLLPDHMKSWFVMPYELREEEGRASYRMERLHAPDLAIRYVHGSIGEDEFRAILKKLFRFLGDRQARRAEPERYHRLKEKLYIEKPAARIEDFRKMAGADRIDALIATGTGYNGVSGVFEEYRRLYGRLTEGFKEETIEVIGHGDLCFSNILYQSDADMIKLIDPKGAENEDELFTDPWYDVAKLSHSICGGYDFINSALYEIVLDESMRLKLSIDADNTQYKEIFGEFVHNAGYDLKMVRLYECSLFLSMLPMHIDRPNKVTAFILNAIRIMEEIKNG